jgi:hypothetical protein
MIQPISFNIRALLTGISASSHCRVRWLNPLLAAFSDPLRHVEIPAGRVNERDRGSFGSRQQLDEQRSDVKRVVEDARFVPFKGVVDNVRHRRQVGHQVRYMLGRLHDLYGRDQLLSAILGGLDTRLDQARMLYGPNRSISVVVSGLYEKLSELRKLYGFDSIEEILDLTIDLKRRLDRMAEPQGKVVLSAHELREFQVLKQQFKQYLASWRGRKRNLMTFAAKTAYQKAACGSNRATAE